MLSVGIIGLPNVGKSTLFNALTTGDAQVSNYPFTTIEPNLGVVAVPDPRLERLAGLLKPEKVTPCSIRFVDIAGLVKGASRGEGLGNQFLGEIRQVDAIAEVVRLFVDGSVAHVFPDLDAVRDVEIVQTELLLADLEVLSRAIAKREREWCTHPQAHGDERARSLQYRQQLERGLPLRSLKLTEVELGELSTMGMLSGKPMLLVANTSEPKPPAAELALVERLRQSACAAEVVVIAARLEWEIAQLEPNEREEFMRELEMEGSGLDRIVQACFRQLGLITFYTIAKNKLQAWAIPRGTHTAAAAGKVHTDMERGFIRANVASATDLEAQGSWHSLHRAGLLRTVGRDHEVADGDVLEFLFNV